MIYNQSLFIMAPASKVWDALINPEVTPQYLSCSLVSDWTPGNPVVWKSAANENEHAKGTVLNFEPEKELAYTVFDPNAGYVDDPVNYLTNRFELIAENGGTRLEFSLGDFASVENGEKRYREAVISWEMTLNTLKRLLED